MPVTNDPYAARPWLKQYGPGQPADLDVPDQSMLEAIARQAEAYPDFPLMKYFDGVISYRELDRMSDALAVALRRRGFGLGDRLAIMAQNVPQFVIGMVATWKAGGVVVSVNPMNKEREVRYILDDSGAKAILCLQSLYTEVVSKVRDGSALEIVITTSELRYQTRNDPRVFDGITDTAPPGAEDAEALIQECMGQKPPAVSLTRDDVAIITYTSGTTGEPKGATNTHLNVLHNALAYEKWMELTSEDVILGVAPLFHITGSIGHMAAALCIPATLVLAYRFEPAVVADAIEEHQCTFTVGSITVFIALMNAAGVRDEQMASLKKIYSGGAPIPASVLDRVRDRWGVYIHNVYGLTETTSPSHGVPVGAQAPVDPDSGAVSVGVPIYGTVVRILDDDGVPVPVGELGELQTEGPGVVPAYWRKPQETARSIPGGRLNTGDVGFMDTGGWFYIVDRKKDMINAAGYKVWPREVEDVLYGHPAVREAAVVGVPDEYRGETVKAIVSLQAGASADPEELIAFCKQRMAAYKYPREVVIMEELPKTVSGKILRRELRGR